MNEFHTQNAACSSLIPSGRGYEHVSVANQVCSTVGSLPGQSDVSGSRYAELNYGFTYHHLWRDYAIIVAFGAAFITGFLFFTELNTSASSETSVVTYLRRGKKRAAEASRTPSDTSKTKMANPSSNREVPTPPTVAHPTSEIELSSMNSQNPGRVDVGREMKIHGDIFSWESLCYTVPLPHGKERQLLEDVSGYVVPGKLTALMGESGAGKTTLLNVLSERTTGGFVTGERFLDGRPLPVDFQARTGYCQQMDVHLSSTTVREALLFSAKLRQPRSVPLQEKEAL